MEMQTKVKACAALSVIALVMQIVVFVCPGWVILKSRGPGHLMVDAKHVTVDTRSNITVLFGVWYYKACKSEINLEKAEKRGTPLIHRSKFVPSSGPAFDSNHEIWHVDRKCYIGCFKKRLHVIEDSKYDGTKYEEDIYENDIPADFEDVTTIITTSVDFARSGRHEIAVYLTIGLCLGVSGVTFSVVFVFKQGKRKLSGRLACSSLVFSSFFAWLAIIRVATCVFQLRLVQAHERLDDHYGSDIRFSIPWCLPVAAVGAILMDVSALLHLVVLSMNKRLKGLQLRQDVEMTTGTLEYQQSFVPYHPEEFRKKLLV